MTQSHELKHIVVLKNESAAVIMSTSNYLMCRSNRTSHGVVMMSS